MFAAAPAAPAPAAPMPDLFANQGDMNFQAAPWKEKHGNGHVMWMVYGGSHRGPLVYCY